MTGFLVLTWLHASLAAEVDLGAVVVPLNPEFPRWMDIQGPPPSPPQEGLPVACAGLPGAALPAADPDPAAEEAAAACLAGAEALSAGGWMRLGELRQAGAFGRSLVAFAELEACWHSGAASYPRCRRWTTGPRSPHGRG